MNGCAAAAGLRSAVLGSITNINFRNNIVKNTSTQGYISFWDGTGVINGVQSLNNTLYNNANSNLPYYWNGKIVLNFSSLNNRIADPQLDSNFHLLSTSTSIDSGLNLGYPYLRLAPDAGAFELK